MNAVRNYVAVPFFDRVPPRVMDLVLITFDNIVERAQSQREAYHFFANAVKKRQFEGPTFVEFADWHERVKNGLIERPHPSEVVPIKPSVAFFDNVPIRACAAVRHACDLIALGRHGVETVFTLLAAELNTHGIAAPARDEFDVWFEQVKLGRFTRANYDHGFLYLAPEPFDLKPSTKGLVGRAFAASLGYPLPIDGASTLGQAGNVESQVDESPEKLRLAHARAIVEAAHHLFEAKTAAGHSPSLIHNDDTILQQALQEVLSAEASATVMDADVHMTPGNKLVDLLLGEGDDDIDAKLVDCLTIDMQPELCRILARAR